jgi:hypothetical protein
MRSLATTFFLLLNSHMLVAHEITNLAFSTAIQHEYYAIAASLVYFIQPHQVPQAEELTRILHQAQDQYTEPAPDNHLILSSLDFTCFILACAMTNNEQVHKALLFIYITFFFLWCKAKITPYLAHINQEGIVHLIEFFERRPL